MTRGRATVRDANPGEPEIVKLVDALDRYQRALYPPESNHLEPIAALQRDSSIFLGVYCADRAIACGAAKLMHDDGDYGEIKRVYVDPAWRGQGVSKLLMSELEQRLLARQISTARLETGIHQPEAIGLYQAIGYRLRDPFGAYSSDPLSVFMEKELN